MRLKWLCVLGALALALLQIVAPASASAPAPAPAVQAAPAAAAATAAPNIFFYNLDDLRDRLPGGVDPLQFMPKLRQWMAAGTRYTEHVRRRPVLLSVPLGADDRALPAQQRRAAAVAGPELRLLPHSIACYLQGAGYATYVDGKFLTTWPKTSLPPCFDHAPR